MGTRHMAPFSGEEDGAEDVSACWDPSPGSRWLFCKLGMCAPHGWLSQSLMAPPSPQAPAAKLCNNYIL